MTHRPQKYETVKDIIADRNKKKAELQTALTACLEKTAAASFWCGRAKQAEEKLKRVRAWMRRWGRLDAFEDASDRSKVLPVPVQELRRAVRGSPSPKE